MEKFFKIDDDAIDALDFVSNSELITGGKNGQLNLWDLQEEKLIRSFNNHHGKILQCKYVDVMESHLFYSSASDGKVVLWNYISGILLDEFNINDVLKSKIHGKSNPFYVRHITINPNRGQLLLQLGGYQPLYIWDFWNSRLSMLGGTVEIPIGGTVSALHSWSNLAITCSGQALYLYNLENGRLIQKFGGMPLGYTDKVNDYITSPSQMNDLLNQTLSRSGGYHTKPITSIEFSDNGNNFLTGSEDFTVRMWNLQDIQLGNNKLPKIFQGHTTPVVAAAFLNREYFASASENGEVFIWDTISGNLFGQRIISKQIGSFGISPNGDTIAAGTKDGNIFLWKL